ncbi:uncharacterized protein LOC126567800 [Anopheles maculipalpis]|uniref:uncharacterized protein LOC126567800 n=1 Tax=Anopheles maculipalpis TaxID=1496333 RepID=UPI0021596659|nr:uncharacterized protein LOC126567800 [Anopheles maculipalpis]
MTEVETSAVAGSSPGPRVSFNRDVHVKRIGPRLEGPRSSPANGTVRKELPENLSQEALRREAEFVLAQADKIDRSRANGTGATPSSADPLGAARFNSLPSRSKSRTKKVTRSSSDAASKKPTAKSLLNLFGRKQADEHGAVKVPLSAANQAPSSRSTLGRSKSDVGSSSTTRNGSLVKQRKVPRRATQELGDLRSIIGKKNDPLTPIIEASPLEYTQQTDPLTAYVRRGRAVSEEPKSSSRAVPKPGVMETITLLRSSNTAKSQEALHSSQLPPEKPHLTKGVTVENIVKRLSSERHTSPPPAQIVGGGFSYTRGPGEPIVYAQVVSNEANKSKHTVKHQHYPSTEDEDPAGPTMWTSTDSKMRPTGSFLDTTQRPSPPLPKYRLDEADHSPLSINGIRRKQHTNSDEDEGLGIDYSRQQQRYKSSAYVHTSSSTTQNTSRTSPKSFHTNSDEDPPIAPSVVRLTPAEKTFSNSYSVHYRGQADGKEHLPEFHELSQRREILESRIRSRIGSRDLLDRASPERSVPVPIKLTSGAHRTASSSSSTSKYRTTTERRSVDRVLDRHESPVRRSTLSPTPTKFRESSQDRTAVPRRNSRGYVETFVTKTVVNRDGKPVSEEYVERYKYPGDNVEAVTSSRTVYDREGSAGRTEIQRFNRYVPEQGMSSSYTGRNTIDKGDSGIENDFRKDSFNQEFISGTKFTLTENIRTCEDFLRMERTHTNSCMRKSRKAYVYRERSIDDGSRYDPRLDEISASRSYTRDTLKPSLKVEKKPGSLAKVKQFVSSTRKKLVRMGQDGSDKREHSRAGSLRSDSADGSRIPDIATRRRLSTPKSSPSSAKRSLSFKSSKLSASSPPDASQKQASSRSDWFKSFDRLSRKKSSSKPNLTTDTKTPPPAKQAKSLRFFGDTDTEYGDQNVSSYRSARSNLSKTDKKYRSAYDLDTAPKMRDTARNRSSSLHNLDEEDELSLRGKDYRSEEHSSTFYRARSPSPSDYRQDRTTARDYTPERVARKTYQHHRSRENNVDLMDSERSETPLHHRPGSRSRGEHKKPPSGPQKPARAFERRDSLNRDIDRILDSSGTEGESSQQSQRSVVFLHATTVGDIPHPQIANARRRAYSRESLNNSIASSKKVQPMTRTVSRSISVLAPWKPKNIREGYEIDYHKDQHQAKPISTLPRSGATSRQSTAGSQSTLSRSKHRSQSGRDDPDSDKSSSFEQSRRLSADQQRRPSGSREAGGLGTPYASTTLPSSRRVKDSIAQYPSRTTASGSTLKYRR